MQHTHKNTCVYKAPLTDKDAHKDSLEQMHAETTAKRERSSRGSRARKSKGATERAEKEKEQIESEQAREVTHWVQEGHGKNIGKRKSAKKRRRGRKNLPTDSEREE